MKILYISTLCLGLFGIDSFGHEIPVHRAITFHAAASARVSAPAYASFVDVISSDLPYDGIRGAANYMVEGSEHEDDIKSQDPVGGNRSLAHFYDPLNGAGLSERPILGGTIRKRLGTNSFDWATIRNCTGIPVLINPQSVNTWSWQNARDYQWDGLTAEHQSERQAALGNMFRAVGQVMHLLQDASQPQHVRNEQHVSFRFLRTPWKSAIEEYGEENLTELDDHAVLPWSENGFTKVRDFWDRDKYTVSSPAGLVADASTDGVSADRLGMAEFANGNFLSGHHLFPEYYNPGSTEYYPYPSRDNSTTYNQVKANPATGLRPLVLKNGQTKQGVYLSKNAHGVFIDRLCRVNYLGIKANLPDLIGPVYCTIKDPAVLTEYHDILIPKAVEYSAGLLDYFFRGQISVGIHWNGTAYQVRIMNNSGDDFGAGQFTLWKEDDASGNRTPVVLNLSYPGTLAAGGHIDGTFPGPLATATTKYVLVFKGTIGLTAGSPSDNVDENIAKTCQSSLLTQKRVAGMIRSDATQVTIGIRGCHLWV